MDSQQSYYIEFDLSIVEGGLGVAIGALYIALVALYIFLSRVALSVYYLVRPETCLRDHVISSRLMEAVQGFDWPGQENDLNSPVQWRIEVHKKGYIIAGLLYACKRRFRKKFPPSCMRQIEGAIDSLAGTLKVKTCVATSSEDFRKCSAYAVSLISHRDPVAVSKGIVSEFGEAYSKEGDQRVDVRITMISVSDFIQRVGPLGKIILTGVATVIIIWLWGFSELVEFVKKMAGG